MSPHVEQLIVCHEPRGNGTEEDPCRIITRVYQFNGDFVAEYDPIVELPPKEQP